MPSIDLETLQRRSRVRYELRRLRNAFFAALPLVFVATIAACVTTRPSTALAFGGVATAVGVLMLFYGRDPQRAVLPGMTAGVVPLIFALAANHVHHCASGVCTTWCVPACTVGGVVAGLWVAHVGHTRGLGTRFLLCASAVAWLTGAMGCSCAGYTGVVGLTMGYALGIVPGLLRRYFRRYFV